MVGLIERGILGVTLFSIATTLRNSIAQWSTDCLIGHIHFRNLFLYKFDFSTREKRRIMFCEPTRRYRWSNFWLFEKNSSEVFFCKTSRTVKNFSVKFPSKKDDIPEIEARFPCHKKFLISITCCVFNEGISCNLVFDAVVAKVPLARF